MRQAWRDAEPHSFMFIGSCPQLPGPFVSFVAHHGVDHQVEYATFAKWAAEGTAQWWVDEVAKDRRFGLSADPYIGFFKSFTPSGIPVVYFVWSAMEFMFVPADRYNELDLRAEADLADW